MQKLSVVFFLAFFGIGSICSAPSLAQTLSERGAYLVNGIGTCGNCHTPKGGPFKDMPMAGGFRIGEPNDPFVAYASNITPDKETGIGAWTDAQIIAAIREGKRPDGTIVGPPMPTELYNKMSDNDVKAMVAYLRTLKPVKNKVQKSVYRIPLHAAPPAGHVADVPRIDPVRYGAYLAGPLGHCIECHTPRVRGRNDFEHQLGRGGNPFGGPWCIAVSRNITPHAEDGIGKWTDAQIKRAITTGVRADGTRLNPPMGYPMYATMTDSDLNAIVAYLRSLKPLASK